MKSIMKRRFSIIIAALLIGISSCEEGNNDQVLDMVGEEDSASIDEMKSIFYMIPSPMETAIILKHAGAIYDGSLLNDPVNVSNYDTKAKQAINLGIYGADLSYATLFNQSQEIMFYVTAAKRLAENLGIMNAFDENTITRVENNVEDKDSMMIIVSEVYWMADAYLKETDNIETSSLVLYGGWLEALHIAASLYQKNPDNEDLKSRIAEQKYSLENLVGLLKKTSYESEEVKSAYEELLKIQKIYDRFEVLEGEASLKVDKTTGVNIIEGDNTLSVPKEQFEELFALINKIRENHI